LRFYLLIPNKGKYKIQNTKGFVLRLRKRGSAVIQKGYKYVRIKNNSTVKKDLTEKTLKIH